MFHKDMFYGYDASQDKKLDTLVARDINVGLSWLGKRPDRFGTHKKASPLQKTPNVLQDRPQRRPKGREKMSLSGFCNEAEVWQGGRMTTASESKG